MSAKVSRLILVILFVVGISNGQDEFGYNRFNPGHENMHRFFYYRKFTTLKPKPTPPPPPPVPQTPAPPPVQPPPPAKSPSPVPPPASPKPKNPPSDSPAPSPPPAPPTRSRPSPAPPQPPPQGAVGPAPATLTRSQKRKVSEIVKDLRISINGKRIKADEKFFKGEGDIADYLYGQTVYERALVWEQMMKLNEMVAKADGRKIDRSANQNIEDIDGTIDDMVFSLKEAKFLIEFYKNNPSYMKLNGKVDKTRGAITKEYKPWKMPIKYKIKKGVNSNLVANAIKVWQGATCIRFKKRPRLLPILGPNIFFEKVEKGCRATVGRRKFKNGIWLSSSCSLGNVIHEIGHAIGFFHEQSRPDRKVTIVEKYIKEGKEKNFRKLPWSEVETFSFPYDFASVMHYGPFAFTTESGKKTIKTHPRYYEKTIGQRLGLSFLDAKAANWQYCRKACKGKSSLVWSKCKNGGYRNPNKCKECVCPDGWGGKFCDKLEGSHKDCGQTKLNAKVKHRTFTSPLYDKDGYTDKHECTWRIRSTPADQIIFRFRGSFRLRCHTPCRDYVEVRYRDTKLTGPRYCCSKRPKRTFKSKGRQMLIIFRTNSGKGRKGFKAVYYSKTRPRSNGH